MMMSLDTDRAAPCTVRSLSERLARVLLAVQVGSPGNARRALDELSAIAVDGERFAWPSLLVSATGGIVAAHTWLSLGDSMDSRIRILRLVRTMQAELDRRDHD